METNRPSHSASDRLHRPVYLARLFFVLLTTWLAALLAWRTAQDARVFSVVAFFGAVAFVLIEISTNAIASRKILLAAAGCLAGLIFARLIYRTIPTDIVDSETSLIICNAMFGYFGVILALRHADWLRPGNLKFFFVNPTERPKILDSSVIIDGRIIDLMPLGILSGRILIPSFVLHEIQGIADSSDPNRRARGRRGLGVLDWLRQECKSLDIIDNDYPEIPDVDDKLMALCRTMNADLVTNDYNLHKIAQLHQIHVLNFNELADALRPGVFVGETMNLQIAKAGKETGQGVGYLQDGTMVIVENSDQLIGQEVEVVVNNILQNPTGRLIFARIHHEEGRQDEGRRMHA